MRFAAANGRQSPEKLQDGHPEVDVVLPVLTKVLNIPEIWKTYLEKMQDSRKGTIQPESL